MRQEAVRGRLVVKQPDLRLLDDRCAACLAVAVSIRTDDRRGRPSPNPWATASRDRLPDPREHRDLDRPGLDVPDVVGGVALSEYDISLSVLRDLAGRASRLEIRVRIEQATSLPDDPWALWLHEWLSHLIPQAAECDAPEEVSNI